MFWSYIARISSSASRNVSWHCATITFWFCDVAFSASDVMLDTSKLRYASFSVALGPPTQPVSNLVSDEAFAVVRSCSSSPGGAGIGNVARVACQIPDTSTRHRGMSTW